MKPSHSFFPERIRAATARERLDGRRCEGFTLVEILVVVGIIAALVAILIPIISGAKKRAAVAQGQALIGALRTGLEAYYGEFNMYPPSNNGTNGQGAALLATALNGDGTGFYMQKAGGGVSLAFGGGAGVGKKYGPYGPTDSYSASGFMDPWGNVIYYYRVNPLPANANSGWYGSIFGGTTNCYFNGSDNGGNPSGAPGGFFRLISGNTNNSVSGAVTGSDSYLLICAGVDGQYFTADDTVGSRQ